MSELLGARVSELETRVRALEQRAVVPSSTPAIPAMQSPREFLLGKGPKSDNDKALAAGYYLEVISGEQSFNADQIVAFFGEAKEAAPANRSDPPYQNMKKGYFREVGTRHLGQGARNKWALTNSGISRVEQGFVTGGRK